jgi:hypothetical protein
VAKRPRDETCSGLCLFFDITRGSALQISATQYISQKKSQKKKIKKSVNFFPNFFLDIVVPQPILAMSAKNWGFEARWFGRRYTPHKQ